VFVGAQRQMLCAAKHGHTQIVKDLLKAGAAAEPIVELLGATDFGDAHSPREAAEAEG